MVYDFMGNKLCPVLFTRRDSIISLMVYYLNEDNYRRFYIIYYYSFMVMISNLRLTSERPLRPLLIPPHSEIFLKLSTLII